MKTQTNKGAWGKGNKAIKGSISSTEYKEQLRAEIPIPLWAAGVQGNRAPLAVSKDKAQDRLAGKGKKIGKGENYCDTQKRKNEEHPFASLVSFVACKILNPALSKRQREALPILAKGRKSKRSKIESYSDEIEFAGFASRSLSETDRDELFGAITLAIMAEPTDPRTLIHALGLSYRGEMPDGTAKLTPARAPAIQRDGSRTMHATGLGHPFAMPWQQIFCAARATLGVKRLHGKGAIRLLSIEEMMAGGMECTEDHTGETSRERDGSDRAAIAQASIRADREREAIQAGAELERAAILGKARDIAREIRASRDAEKTSGVRRWNKNWRGALGHLRDCVKVAQGQGHRAEKSRTAYYERAKAFAEYRKIGQRAENGMPPALATLSLEKTRD